MSKWILVNSHRRSGTHFLIDSIRTNVPSAIFPQHKDLPGDFNVGALFRKQEEIYKVFLEMLGKDTPVIIKSHLLPEEMNIVYPKNKYEELVGEIYRKSYKLYIYRNGKDVLVSLYHFLNSKSEFKNFLREKNDDIAVIRNIREVDYNRVIYWAYHVNSWLAKDDVLSISFEDLKNDFQDTMKGIINFIDEKCSKKMVKPQIPQRKLVHFIKLRLYKFGLIKSLNSTAIKPRKGMVGSSRDYFDEENMRFFEEQIKLKQ